MRQSTGPILRAADSRPDGAIRRCGRALIRRFRCRAAAATGCGGRTGSWRRPCRTCGSRRLRAAGGAFPRRARGEPRRLPAATICERLWLDRVSLVTPWLASLGRTAPAADPSIGRRFCPLVCADRLSVRRVRPNKWQVPLRDRAIAACDAGHGRIGRNDRKPAVGTAPTGRPVNQFLGMRS